jgi:anti-sigma-K factor RskA
MSDSFAHSDEDDVLAGEYVLGVLTLSERLSIESRIKLDQGFARRIANWENYLGVMNDGYAELKAPNVLRRVETRLFPKKRKISNFSWFQFLLGTASAAAVAMALFLILPNQPRPQLVATLQAEAQPLVFAASYDGEALYLQQTSGPAPEAGRVYQLWLIAGDAAPVSLGVIDGTMARSPLAQLARGMVLAVSLEPTGGSPTGAPTGPVLVKGAVGT